MSGQTQAPGSTSSSDGGSAQSPVPRYPSSVVKAVWVMLAQIVLSWLGIALAVIEARVVGEVTVWVVLIAVFSSALYALLARQVLGGAHWAQVVVWFLAGANAFFGVVVLVTADQHGWSDAVSVVAIAMNVALVVLLATRPSAAHFGRTP